MGMLSRTACWKMPACDCAECHLQATQRPWDVARPCYFALYFIARLGVVVWAGTVSTCAYVWEVSVEAALCSTAGAIPPQLHHYVPPFTSCGLVQAGTVSTSVHILCSLLGLRSQSCIDTAHCRELQLLSGLVCAIACKPGSRGKQHVQLGRIADACEC